MRALLGAISVLGAPGRPSRHSFRWGQPQSDPPTTTVRYGRAALFRPLGRLSGPKVPGGEAPGPSARAGCSLCNARAGLVRILVLSCHDGGLRSTVRTALSVGKAAALAYRYGAARGAARTQGAVGLQRPPADTPPSHASDRATPSPHGRAERQGCLAGARCGTACGTARTASSRWAPTAT